MRPALAQDMANYNRWMNQRIYDVCSQLSDQELREDRKAFFGSIHGTLNHLLLGDKIWLGRFLGSPYTVAKLDEEIHHSFLDLKTDREATDQAIIDWANGLTDDVLDSTLEYRSVVNPQPRSYEMWLAVNHFFNHQTHHRGQVTTLLCQVGLDVGLTDLIWLPDVVERNT
ncbi:DinB family protein [Marinomonas gallaica]|uniref:DinB family protein n=1 Tax=Marinomonas gallaica TaxID=1806667 RepID=A0A1C3JS78_9GAMM|nr:DinB family protein [Marinomonas gallaica]SBT17889.1 DinB family protein [Marinomonas gallaica]SBT22025.1 DinB family protein [Marinomonas gallaica]